MGINQRLVATVLIWMAVAAVAMFGIGFRWDEPALVIMTTIFAIAAASSTNVIWKSAGNTAALEAAEKAKRQGKVERLMNNLDERDLEELRARLMAESDGEQVSLDELMRRR